MSFAMEDTSRLDGPVMRSNGVKQYSKKRLNQVSHDAFVKYSCIYEAEIWPGVLIASSEGFPFSHVAIEYRVDFQYLSSSFPKGKFQSSRAF